jgi:hypothetical protein
VGILHHPQFEVLVDGQPLMPMKDEFNRFAIPLFPGKHEVVITYQEYFFNLGFALALIALTLQPIVQKRMGTAS